MTIKLDTGVELYIEKGHCGVEYADNSTDESVHFDIKGKEITTSTESHSYPMPLEIKKRFEDLQRAVQAYADVLLEEVESDQLVSHLKTKGRREVS